MDFTPRRTLGTLIGVCFLLLLLGAAAAGLSQLNVSPVTTWIIVWVLLPLVSLPLMAVVGFRMYGLLTATYRIDREAFFLGWGPAQEQIPIELIQSVQHVSDLDTMPRPAPGWWWPGCVVTRSQRDARPPLEIFAGAGWRDGIVISSPNRRILIAPSHPAQFVKSFTDATRMGSLHPVEAMSERPVFVFTDVWGDRLARTLILVGALLPLGLLAYVGWAAAGLPGAVPFGFDALGRPGPEAPPGRLLLLPFMAGALWLIDLGLGAWLYRAETERRVAYTLWAIAPVGGLLLWGAALHLISNI